ncbi:GTP-binding and nucleic acid-binding protein [Candidatus Arthromitus sp. SFB-mouse-NL]|uniref:redox-regulated ATPase YchF n=1 Tax=Candidatus Arthromitus sp. SFB-mouse-NL TaxID=1508644 RepID=UPI00049B2360|nr:redox-regulated ATPase YchF [Candidatus Arthromitus sp. SFB-mouse-NL]AID44898.1 GTP-binding and nucleic acid-binding protein [Candidatus Arthromitus sp. SFB-mouse-NL]
MKLGIVGLPNVGKSTLFNAITKAGAESANYPFCTIEPNVGIVTVPDNRLDELEKIYNTKKKVYASIEFYDIAGLVKGASQGEGLGNKFLSHIREVEAIVHVVRCFEDSNIVHVNGQVDPLDDIEIINLELILSDLEIVQRRIDKIIKLARSGDKDSKIELDILERVKVHLEQGKMVRSMDLTKEEEERVKKYFLITSKKTLYACNISEDEFINKIENDMVKKVKEFALNEKSEAITLCAKFEEELSSLDEDDRSQMMEEYDIKESGLDQLIVKSYSLLGLISYLTAGVQEVRAWTITEGTKAPQAAGKIHSDIERGFIRAEVISYDKMIECKSEVAAKEKGYYRLEGKEYVVRDGDIINFRFNV